MTRKSQGSERWNSRNSSKASSVEEINPKSSGNATPTKISPETVKALPVEEIKDDPGVPEIEIRMTEKPEKLPDDDFSSLNPQTEFTPEPSPAKPRPESRDQCYKTFLSAI